MRAFGFKHSGAKSSRPSLKTRVAMPSVQPVPPTSAPASTEEAVHEPAFTSTYHAELQSGTFSQRPPPLGRDPMVLEPSGASPKQNTENNSEAMTFSDMIKGGGQVGSNNKPRFFSPILQSSVRKTRVDRSKLPLLVYLPGIDGLGLAASRQFARLQQGFDLRSMSIPVSNRDNFMTLVKYVEEYIDEELKHSDPLRPVYLLGESFGGILALKCALDFGPEKVHRVILVNPATSFPRAPWSTIGPILTSLPPDAYKNLPLVLSPILSNPLGLAAFIVQQNQQNRGNPFLPPSPIEVITTINQLVQGLTSLLPSLGALADILPPETLAWKLKLLQEGCDIVNPQMKKVEQRTLALFSDLDLLIPSREEAQRYKRSFPRARVQTFPGRGHALLQEGGVDLMDILSQNGFYQSKRVLSSPLDFTPNVAGKKKTRAAKREASDSNGGEEPAASSSSSPSAPATAVPYRVRPLDLPTRKELEIQSRENNIELFRRAVSPVFLSKDENGRIARGLGNVPTHKRPVLLIGNHQTWAPDLGLIITEFIEEKSTMPRGLAHPAIFNNFGASSREPAKPETRQQPGIPGLMTGRGQGAREGDQGQGGIGYIFSQFGAIPVGPKNFYRALQNGECILLFPGGVREAYKRRGEKYQLFWPENAEFVRMAARFGATIVPFSAVGAEDGVDIVLDSEELKKLPFLGERVKESAKNIPKARRGASADNYSEVDGAEDFIAPLIFPSGAPERYYFLFQKPITLTGTETRDECQQIYATAKKEVEDGLEFLQVKRQADAFRKFEPRILWEAPSGFQRQAPTFPLE